MVAHPSVTAICLTSGSGKKLFGQDLVLEHKMPANIALEFSPSSLKTTGSRVEIWPLSEIHPWCGDATLSARKRYSPHNRIRPPPTRAMLLHSQAGAALRLGSIPI